jgi:hypothetical protein
MVTVLRQNERKGQKERETKNSVEEEQNVRKQKIK